MLVITKLNKASKITRSIVNFNVLKALAAILVCLLIAGAVLPVVSFAADKTTLVSPTNGATNVNNTDVVFTWQKVSDNVSYYKFDLATDAGFSSMFISDAYPDTPTFTVTKTMTFGVKYYWRVTAVFPGDVIGESSTVWSFTVRSEGTPAQTTTPVTTPSTTTPAGGSSTTTPSGSGSSSGGIMGFIDEIGWPLTLGMVGIVVIFIILLSILLTKPKKSPAGMGPGMSGGMGGMGGRMGPQQQRSQQGPGMACPNCGFMNTPDRKFCANCGTTIGAGQQFQAPPFQQQQYQGMPYQAENQAPPFRPPQPPPFQGQQFQGQQQYQPPFQGQPFGQQYGQGPASRMQQQSSVCLTCGTANPPGRQFCGNCGSTLMQAQQQQQRFQTQQQFQPPVFCPSCGAPAQPGQQWCGNCGGNIPVGGGGQQHVVGTYQTFTCPICGANINRGLNPCPSCGTWLDWGR